MRIITNLTAHVQSITNYKSIQMYPAALNMAADVRKGEPVTHMPTETVKPDPEDTEEIRNRQDIGNCE